MKGKEGDVNDCEALKMKPAELENAPSQVDDMHLKDMGYRKLNNYIDGKTALAYALLYRRYKVNPQSIIEMAPLFFTLLAEGSLASRRERLAQITDAEARLSSLRNVGDHLSFVLATYQVEEGAHEEEASINNHDIFGKNVAAISFDLGYDTSSRNPFADYLRTLASKIPSGVVETDPTGSDYLLKTDEMPEYVLCPEDLKGITDGEYWAEYALERGYARLAEIPDRLMAKDATGDRVAWLISRIPKEVREKADAETADFLSSLGGSNV